MTRPRFRLGTALMVVALVALSLAVVTLTIQLQRTRVELETMRAAAEEEKARAMALLDFLTARVAGEAAGRSPVVEGPSTEAPPGSTGGVDPAGPR